MEIQLGGMGAYEDISDPINEDNMDINDGTDISATGIQEVYNNEGDATVTLYATYLILKTMPPATIRSLVAIFGNVKLTVLQYNLMKLYLRSAKGHGPMFLTDNWIENPCALSFHSLSTLINNLLPKKTHRWKRITYRN